MDKRDSYIRYRFQRAYESYDEAMIMVTNNRWNAVINRLYYACFYAVSAVLLKSEIETQTHDGARTQFNLRFVKTGVVDKELGKLFSKLFDYRQKGDYGDLYDYDETIVKPLINKVHNFIKE